MELLNFLIHWNAILVLIGGFSLIGFAIFFERMIVLRRAEIDSDLFLLGIRQSIEEGNIIAAIEQCERQAGALAHIVKAGLMRHHRSRGYIESAMESTGRLEIALLERNTRVLSIISYVTPLLGLLGTVFGFMQAFGEMRLSGLVDITATGIGNALEYALITTAAGLVVAIPSWIAYHYLLGRVEALILEIQVTSSEVVELLLVRQEDNPR